MAAIRGTWTHGAQFPSASYPPFPRLYDVRRARRAGNRPRIVWAWPLRITPSILDSHQ